MNSHTPTLPASTTSAAHVRARGLRLARGGRVLQGGIDLTLAPGDRLTVVGENGRGKTTLLEALAGTLDPDAGTVERHGSLGIVRQELEVDTAADIDTAAHGPQAAPAGPRTIGDLLDKLLARPLAATAELDRAAMALLDDDSPAATRRYDQALAAATTLDAWDAPRRLEVALDEVSEPSPIVPAPSSPCRSGSATGPDWQGSSPPGRISCCWTSRPITSTGAAWTS